MKTRENKSVSPVRVRRRNGINTDVIMRKTYAHIWRDLSQNVPLSGLAPRIPHEVLEDMSEFRKRLVVPENWDILSSYNVKAMLQVRDFLKRYRFENDAYTQRELEDITLDKFLSVQYHTASSTRPNSQVITAVLGEARRIIRETLGEVPTVGDLLNRCAYGKKADQGCPASEAYLFNKWRYPHTGSPDHVQFHQRAVDTCQQLSYADRYAIPFRKYTTVQSLALTLVPKSWKILRPINPNTRIGAWYTSGIEAVLVEKLRSLNLRLNKLQKKHNVLAKEASIKGHLATADLSAASDCISPWLLRALLPSKWWSLIKFGRITTFRTRGRSITFGSFMGMGIGFTFPLQTLVFYSLIRGVMNLAGIKGHVSVYGDDLIYPTKAHTHVAFVLQKCGFNLNLEKTYVQRCFRESCGGDFHRGVDVRPCSPEGQHRVLDGYKVGEFVYRLINGLKRRWEECELPTTLHYLRSIAAQATLGVLQVPPSFPDFAGEHTVQIRKPSRSEPWWVPIKWNKVIQAYEFTFISQVPSNRIVAVEYPYYWASLQRGSVATLVHPLRSKLPLKTYIRMLKRRDELLLDELRTEVKTKWSKVQNLPKLRLMKIGKGHRARYVSVEPIKNASRILSQSGYSNSWT